MSGMTVCGESDRDLGRICRRQLGDMVCNAVFVSQHKSVVNVPTKK